jgi:N-acetyl sugar amidotransferase
MTAPNVLSRQRCVRCVMDTSDPEITFDDDGVCSHCRSYDVNYRATVEASMSGARLADLDRLVSQIQEAGRGRDYDVIIGVSGGVDSTYLLLKAAELGLRPLAAHFDSGWNSELAVHNIERATSTLGVDLKTDVVNWTEMRDLQLSFFKAGVANCDIPTDHAFPAVALKNATTYGIKYVLSGSNLATESVLPRAWGHRAADKRYLMSIQRAHGSVKLETYPTLGLLKKEIWYRYLRGVRTVKPLNYLPYDKAAAKREITKKLSWRDYGGKHYESVFTRFFQGHYLPRRFGFDKRLAHYSSLILSDQMTRDQALHLIESEPPYDLDLQRTDLRFVAKKLGISVAEFEALIDAPLEDVRPYATNDAAYRLGFKARDLVSRR